MARNIESLCFDFDIKLIIDSELIMSSCECNSDCNCSTHSVPVQGIFQSNSKPTIPHKENVQQRKGEAEISIDDWLVSLQPELPLGKSVISFVTSSDIDAVGIHMYVVNRYWKRSQNGTYINPVYVILVKPGGKYDIYNITTMLEVFETQYKDSFIGRKLASGLCLGGNDFYPKCHQVSHQIMLKLFIENYFTNRVTDILKLQSRHYHHSSETNL